MSAPSQPSGAGEAAGPHGTGASGAGEAAGPHGTGASGAGEAAGPHGSGASGAGEAAGPHGSGASGAGEAAGPHGSGSGRRVALLLLASLVGAFATWAVYLRAADPAFTREALARDLLAVLVAGIARVAVLGAGRLVREALRRRWPSPVAAGDDLHDLVAGHAVAAAVLLPLGATGHLSALTAAPLALLGFGVLLGRRARRAGAAAATDDRLRPAVLVACVALLAPLLLVALAPPLDTDELYWHLAAPARILRGHGLPGGWLDPVASRPLALQLLYAAILSAGGPNAVKVYHWSLAFTLCRALFDVVRAHDGTRAGARGGALAALLLAGTWSFLDDVPLAHDNVPTALCVLAAADAALRVRQGYGGRLALATGVALSLKYTAAPALAGLWLVRLGTDVRPVGRRLGETAVLALLAVAVVSPWWIRNVVMGLHPLFPYAGWPATGGFVFAWPQKYGVGHGVADFLRLPWDLVMSASTRSFVYLGRLHPLWVLWLPCAVWAGVWDRRVRGLLVASLVGLLGWFVGVQWMRHLVPLAPVVALAWGLAAARLPADLWRVALVVWAILLPSQVTDAVARAGKDVAVVTGQESPADFYQRELPAWPAIAWVDEHAPADAKVAMLFTGETYLVDRDVVLGSVEDHTPTRYFVVTHPDGVVAGLRQAGARYAVVQKMKFLRKTYPFLDDAAFAAQLKAPPETLDADLLAHGTLVFESGRFSVWDLGTETSPRAP